LLHFHYFRRNKAHRNHDFLSHRLVGLGGGTGLMQLDGIRPAALSCQRCSTPSPIAIVSKRITSLPLIQHHLLAIVQMEQAWRGRGSWMACRSAGLSCRRAKPLPHRHRLSHCYQYIHRSTTYHRFSQILPLPPKPKSPLSFHTSMASKFNKKVRIV
jgi:hypothetical protein